MNRRRFLQMSAGTVAASAVTGCSRIRKSTAAGSAVTARPMTASDFRTTRKFVTTPFCRTAYEEQGSGQAALFLHGFPLNSFQWRGVLSRLSAHRRCIAPDFMGLGYTEVHMNQSVLPLAQVVMLKAVLDSLSISTVDLIANNSGGAVAQLFVTRYSQRVRTLLLTNCDVEPDSPPAAVLPVIELARAGTFADLWLAPWVADKALARSAKGLGGIAYTYPGQLSDETIEYYLAPLVSSPRRKALVNAYAMGLDPNPLAGIEPA